MTTIRSLQEHWKLALGILCLGLLSLGPAQAALNGGWSTMLPYQFERITADGIGIVSGIDIEVMQAAARRAGFRAAFEEVSRASNVKAVRAGQLDFSLAEQPRASAHDWAWFTLPYRKASVAIVMRRGELQPWKGADPRESLRRLLESGATIAVNWTFDPGPEATALLESDAFRGQVLDAATDADSVAHLLTGEADAVIGDRRSMASAVVQAGAVRRVRSLPGDLNRPELSIMLSKKTVSSTTFQALDRALREMRDTGELNRIARHSLVPEVLRPALQTLWFRSFDIIGTIAFAISGVLIARRERYDIVGALVLAALPAVGGGVMRDLISGRSPIGILQSPTLLLLVLGTVLAALFIYAIHDIWGNSHAAEPAQGENDPFRWASTRGLLEVSDAIGLAAFTVTGVIVAAVQRCEPLWLWGPLLAAMTAAGGGVLRDVLRSQADIPTLKGTLYPEIALFWGLVYSLMIHFIGPDLLLSTVLMMTITVIIAGFLSRIVVINFGWHSLFLSFPARRAH
ncbi:TRIC cation channel family protein [Thiorhodovibrio frisius]|uniref:Putative membrane protein n=1 Tax=Thiorhodovibrio frisius TaxID=631362 RepID=H8Z8I8_9GAMM|nr:TRIC cation channel family protein [Thiorhodovibrio frisius]EIC19393.1 putative membrane protein [Thiorhodovibrio frisius]WPL22306.1 putative membrane protein [Thiorhodovibrio frisius]